MGRNPFRTLKAILFVAVYTFYLFCPPLLSGEEVQTDLNRYYRFPLSIGVEYQTYSPFAQYGSEYNIFELSGNIRWPIPPLPVLQPFIKGGMINFDSQNQENPYKWDHTHWFGGLGIGFSHRFAKSFEIGAEISASITQSVFQNLSDSGAVGAVNLLAETGLRIALNPSFNFTVDVHPSIKYLHSFSPLTDFNGFIFGIGFSGSFRFGKDPDSPQAVIRSIRFDRAVLNPVFAAMQSYYVKNPIGTVTITNTDKASVRDVSISFFQKGFMDSPTAAAVIPEVKGNEQIQANLFASFNSEVFKTEGITPLTGEIIVTYTNSGRAAEQRYSVTYDLHDKTALTWDDDRKVAAFITPADSALRNYTSFVRQSCKAETVRGLSGNLQSAMEIYQALQVIGCMYQIDPRSPFMEVKKNPVIVDSISLPRDTLKRITGDCDDLTVLFCSLLETIGIPTGFITVPGHIYPVFNTGTGPRDYTQIHADRTMTIDIGGELWVPVEITMLGSGGFLEAWRTGIEEYRMFDQDPSKRGFFLTADAQKTYRPVGLKETDLGLQYGSKEEIRSAFKDETDKLIDSVLLPYKDKADRTGGAREFNKLGIAQAGFERYKQAAVSFRKALAAGSGYLSAMVNLANIEFLLENYSRASEEYISIYEKLKEDRRGQTRTSLKILINTSRALYALEKFQQARDYYVLAEQIDAQAVRDFSYLAYIAPENDGVSRSSEAAERAPIFLEEEED